jgi:glutamine cyclotransferase
VNQPTASFSVAPLGRNGNRNQNLNPLVSVETAFDRALHTGGLHVSDGSIYVAGPATAEPEIELIEEVGTKGLRERNLPVPDCTYHLRVVDSIGTEWFVSFDGRLVEDTDGERSFLEAQLSNFYIDGMPSTHDEIERVLGPRGVEALEEWLLEDGRSE